MMDYDDSNREKLVKVKSREGKIFEASLDQLRMCGTITEMMDTLGECDITEIPLIQVDSIALERILRWTDHWKNTPQPTLDDIKNKLAETIDPWDEEFLNMPLSELYELILACNYLGLPGLLWLTTRKIAYMIKGKDPAEIREIFAIDNDWTPEEFERVQRENAYCEEYRD